MDVQQNCLRELKESGFLFVKRKRIDYGVDFCCCCNREQVFSLFLAQKLVHDDAKQFPGKLTRPFSDDVVFFHDQHLIS